LILTGGVSHDYPTSTASLVDLLGGHGIDSVVEEDIDAGFTTLAEGGFDVLLLNTLRWRMETPKHAPLRARWGYEVSDLTRAAVAKQLERGGGIVGLHAASICFDDWPEWRDILGGAWRWDASRHDPPGVAHVRFAGIANPLTHDLPDYEVVDEIYTGLALADDVEPLAWATVEGQSEEHPVLWARTVGNGRVVYDALGHDPRSIRNPVHETLILRSIRWAAGQDAIQGEPQHA
jgi:type 1 glutamine amidotransferase